MELRAHQTLAYQKLQRSVAEGHKRPLLFAPCSFGKTIVAAAIAKNAWSKGNKTLFIVHRRLLATQTKEKFDAYGVPCSILMAGYETDFTVPVMITTHQTYTKRMIDEDRNLTKFFHDANVLLVDECHLGISDSYLKIYERYSKKIIIGLTGSPARGDQRGLGEVFDDLVESVGLQDLTDMGYLAPARYFAGAPVDLAGVKMTGGDYNKKHLQERMNTTKLNGDIVQNWLKLSEGRRTIVFSTGVAHSKNLSLQFEAAGISSEHLDAHDSDKRRMAVLDSFRAGEITVVCNCQLFTEGYDADFVSCIVLARATKSFPLYTQMVGRGQRIYEGKKDFLVLDHGGNIDRFGFLTDPVDWSLDGKVVAWKKPRREEHEKKKLTCKECGAVFDAAPECPECTFPVENFGRKVETTDVELAEVRAAKRKSKKEYTMAEKQCWFSMMQYHRIEHGYAEGWVAHKYKEKFKVWPKGLSTEPLKPTPEFSRWVRYLAIKWHKSNGRNYR